MGEICNYYCLINTYLIPPSHPDAAQRIPTRCTQAQVRCHIHTYVQLVLKLFPTTNSFQNIRGFVYIENEACNNLNDKREVDVSSTLKHVLTISNITTKTKTISRYTYIHMSKLQDQKGAECLFFQYTA